MNLKDLLIKKANYEEKPVPDKLSESIQNETTKFLFSIDTYLDEQFYNAIREKIKIEGDEKYISKKRFKTSSIIDDLIKKSYLEINKMDKEQMIEYFSFKPSNKTKKKLLILRNFDLLIEMVNIVKEKTNCRFTKTEVTKALIRDFCKK